MTIYIIISHHQHITMWRLSAITNQKFDQQHLECDSSNIWMQQTNMRTLSPKMGFDRLLSVVVQMGGHHWQLRAFHQFCYRML
jgi:hypothetical protein